MENMEVKLPASQNALLVLFDDSLSDIHITHTPLLWDMLQNLTDKTLRFTKKDDKYRLTIDINMEKI